MLKQCIANQPALGREGLLLCRSQSSFGSFCVQPWRPFWEEREAGNFVADWQTVQGQ